MIINFINHTQTHLQKKVIEQWVDLSLREMRARRVRHTQRLGSKNELSLVFLGRAEARKINRQFRGKDYATDVLSFSNADHDFGGKVEMPHELKRGLGELVLCVPVCQRQAKEHKLSFNEELGYLIIHGILHLLGYDHEKSPRQEKIMLSIQDRIFEKVGSRLTKALRS